MYQIISRIGKGGFSEVFSCVSLDDKKIYALKKSDLKKMDQEGTKQVLNEIEVMKKLQVTSRVVKLFA